MVTISLSLSLSRSKTKLLNGWCNWLIVSRLTSDKFSILFFSRLEECIGFRGLGFTGAQVQERQWYPGSARFWVSPVKAHKWTCGGRVLFSISSLPVGTFFLVNGFSTFRHTRLFLLKGSSRCSRLLWLGSTLHLDGTTVVAGVSMHAIKKKEIQNDVL